MLDSSRNPVPLPNEMTVLTIENGAELMLTIPDAPAQQSSASGGSGGVRKLKETGRIQLTDQRVSLSKLPPVRLRAFKLTFLKLIFIAPVQNDTFDSLSVPLFSILSTSFEQPVFGSNYFTFGIRPSPDGGLSQGTIAELRLKDRGLFQFVSLLEKSRERAIYMKRQAESDEDTLRELLVCPADIVEN